MCDSPSKPESSEAWAHFTAQSLPTWGILGRMDLSSCPCFPMVNHFSQIVWIWLSFIMAKVLRLPANAICLQAGDVKDLPKRTLQLPEITARTDGRQVHAAGRDVLRFLLGNLISPPEFPHGTRVRASACTRWDRIGLSITLSTSCTQSQVPKLHWRPSPAKRGQAFFFLAFFFSEFKGNIKVNWESRTFCPLLG